MRIVLVLLCACAVGLAQPGVEAEVKKAEMSWSNSIVKTDTATLEKVLADDLVYNHSSGVVDTKKSYFESMKTGALKYISVEYDGLKIRAYGDTAVLNAKIRIKANDHGTMVNNLLLLTHVFVKQSGAWRIVAHQTTKIP